MNFKEYVEHNCVDPAAVFGCNVDTHDFSIIAMYAEIYAKDKANGNSLKAIQESFDFSDIKNEGKMFTHCTISNNKDK